VYCSGLAAVTNLFRDDFRRIAIPVVLVLVLVFDCGVACIFLPGPKLLFISLPLGARTKVRA
jgi:hypothetical protein